MKHLRRYVRHILMEGPEEPDLTRYADALEEMILGVVLSKNAIEALGDQEEGMESMITLDTGELFAEYENVNQVHVGLLVNDQGAIDVEAAYVCIPEKRNESNLILTINIPRGYEHPQNVEKFKEWVSAELADALSHELQHSCDTTEMLSGDIPEGEAKWESLENIEKYYGSQAETRGHVAGIKGRARRTGQDPLELLDFDMETISLEAADRGYTQQELQPILDKIRQKWLDRLGGVT